MNISRSIPYENLSDESGRILRLSLRGLYKSKKGKPKPVTKNHMKELGKFCRKIIKDCEAGTVEYLAEEVLKLINHIKLLDTTPSKKRKKKIVKRNR